MQFKLTLSEIRYISKKFGYPQLIGVDKGNLIIPDTEKKLIESGTIVSINGRLELKNEVRYLFSAWQGMRYSLVRPDIVTNKDLQVILANEKDILIIEKHNKDFVLDLFDFDANVMDNIICHFAEINPKVKCEYGFNISMDDTDFEKMLKVYRKQDLQEWAFKLGIDEDALRRFLAEMDSEKPNHRFLLLDDSVKEVGALLKISCNDDAVMMLKHITPKDASLAKMTLVVGGSRNIIDSIYVI